MKLLQNVLRGGIVLTGGAAEQNGLEVMFREISGYNVRKGYPKPLFSAPHGISVLRTSSTAAIGMILSANDEGIPDCAVEHPEEKETQPEVVVETSSPQPTEQETPQPSEAPEEPTVQQASNGGGKRGGRKGGKKGPGMDDPQQGTLDLIWTTVGDTLLKWYDFMNKGETQD